MNDARKIDVCVLRIEKDGEVQQVEVYESMEECVNAVKSHVGASDAAVACDILGKRSVWTDKDGTKYSIRRSKGKR